MKHLHHTKHQLRSVLIALLLLIGTVILLTDLTTLEFVRSGGNAAASVFDAVSEQF